MMGEVEERNDGRSRGGVGEVQRNDGRSGGEKWCEKWMKEMMEKWRREMMGEVEEKSWGYLRKMETEEQLRERIQGSCDSQQ